MQNEMAKLKHRVQVAEEERDIAIEKERETKSRVLTASFLRCTSPALLPRKLQSAFI